MRFRPAIALFLAYALTLASVLGAVSSASLAGTSHIQLCIAGGEDGKPLPPAHTGDPGLCCLVVCGSHVSAILEVEAALAEPPYFGGYKIPRLLLHAASAAETSSSHPRAPPARA